MTHLLSLLAIGLLGGAVAMSVWRTVRMWRAQVRLRVELTKRSGSMVKMLMEVQGQPNQTALGNEFATALQSAVGNLGPSDRKVLEPLVRQPVEAQARVAVRLATVEKLDRAG